MVDPKRGEVKTYEELQQYGIEQEFRKKLLPRMIRLGDRICNLRNQEQRDNPDLPIDMYGKNITFYKDLQYTINFGELKDKPEEALKSLDGLGL